MALIPVLQSHLPQSMWSDLAMSRLPGVQPLRPGDWLIVDDAYAGQMALRDALIGDRRNAVIQMAKAARPAAEELLDLVLKVLDVTPGFSIAADAVIRPDGELVQLDRSEPLATLGRLVQEDFCLMQKTATEHLLTGAVLCFPANWMLAEKFMAPLSTIHGPVAPYDANIARRVQRLFDAIQVARPLWRSNALYYDDPTLFSPNSEDGPRRERRAGAPYVRSERQCLVRMPKTDAVVFSIHTYVVRREDLSPAQAQAIAEHHQAQESFVRDQ